jgi:hypothetical protein
MPDTSPIQQSAIGGAEHDAPVSIHLTVSFPTSGEAVVLWAHELPGTFRMRSRPAGSFLYEIQSGAGEVLATEPIVADPFLMRACFAANGEPIGVTRRIDTPRSLPLKLPTSGVERALSCGIRVSLYQIDDPDPVPPITPESIDALRPRLRLVSSGQVSGPELRRMLRSFDAEGRPVERFGT